jgi:hypothetical protein
MPSQFPGESKPGGSNTQVQFNDSDAFGGDSGLVFNKSTDVLTAGKLATSDTSATSIDVAGGVTAGTGNVGIISAAGQIPALTSTYLASLDASALTGIGGGKVLQVVSATFGTQVTTTTATLADTGLTVSITPADTGNKVLVIGSCNGSGKDGSTGLGYRLLRDSSLLSDFEGLGGYDAGAGTNRFGGVGFAYLDSPSSTSALAYKVQFKNTLTAGTCVMNGSTAVSFIVVLEID